MTTWRDYGDSVWGKTIDGISVRIYPTLDGYWWCLRLPDGQRRVSTGTYRDVADAKAAATKALRWHKRKTGATT